MSVLELSDEQVISLVRQLPAEFAKRFGVSASIIKKLEAGEAHH